MFHHAHPFTPKQFHLPWNVVRRIKTSAIVFFHHSYFFFPSLSFRLSGAVYNMDSASFFSLDEWFTHLGLRFYQAYSWVWVSSLLSLSPDHFPSQTESAGLDSSSSVLSSIICTSQGHTASGWTFWAPGVPHRLFCIWVCHGTGI
jgi:hypothetical protein